MGAPGDIEEGGDGEGTVQVGGTHDKIEKPALPRTGAGVPDLGLDNESPKHSPPPHLVDLLGGVIEIRNQKGLQPQGPF